MKPTGKENREQKHAEWAAHALEQVRQRREEKEKLQTSQMSAEEAAVYKKAQEQRNAEWATHALEQARQRREEKAVGKSKTIEGKHVERKLPGEYSAEELAAYKRAGDRGVYDSAYAKPEETEPRVAKAEARKKKGAGVARKKPEKNRGRDGDRKYPAMGVTEKNRDDRDREYGGSPRSVHAKGQAEEYPYGGSPENVRARGRVELQEQINPEQTQTLQDLIAALYAAGEKGDTQEVIRIARLITQQQTVLNQTYDQGTVQQTIYNITIHIADSATTPAAGVPAPTTVVPAAGPATPIAPAATPTPPAPAPIPAPIPAIAPPVPPAPVVAPPPPVAPAPDPLMNARNQALNAMSLRFISSFEQGRGRVRGAVLPIAASIAGGIGIYEGLTALGSFPIPVLSALTSAGASLVTSGVRRTLGEGAFSLYARYSHIEGGAGFGGFVKKIGQLFTRGLERAALRNTLGLRNTKEVTQLKFITANNIDAATLNASLNPQQRERLVREGLWWLTAHTAIQGCGAYDTPKEAAEFTTDKVAVVAALDKLLGFVPAGQLNAYIQSVADEAEKREAKVYTRGALAIAGAGALKALALTSMFSWILHKVLPDTATALGNPPKGPTHAGTPPAPAGIPPAPGAPTFPSLKSVPLQDNIGVTLAKYGVLRNRDWVNTQFWTAVVDVNRNNTGFWQQLWKVTHYITAHPGSYDAGTIAAARHGLEAMQKLGVDGTHFVVAANIHDINSLGVDKLIDAVRYVGYPQGAGVQLVLPDVSALPQMGVLNP